MNESKVSRMSCDSELTVKAGNQRRLQNINILQTILAWIQVLIKLFTLVRQLARLRCGARLEEVN